MAPANAEVFAGIAIAGMVNPRSRTRNSTTS
jgi:hypothetical protein